MSSPTITVTVPACKRPELLDEMIRSYRLQTFSDSELLIVDNSADDDTVEKLVASHQATDPRIRIVRNETNIGYAANFIKMLTLASGKYIFVLGDDDMFADVQAVERYVEAFERNQDVCFIYSNQLQFNGAGNVDYAFNYFDSEQKYAAGTESLASTWLKASFIPGIGLRNDRNFQELYPTETLLFPQVEMVGKLVCERPSLGIGEYLVAGRAHQQQLGFETFDKGKRNEAEKHSVDELGPIFRRVDSHARNSLGKSGGAGSERLVHRLFRTAHATIFPTEKIRSGNRRVLQTFRSAMRNDSSTLFDLRFVGYFLVSLALPRKTLFSLKEWRKAKVVQSGFADEQRQFDDFRNQLDSIPVA